MKRCLLTVLPLAVLLSCPLFPATGQAGETFIINDDVTGNVVGNSSKPDHTWDFNSDKPEDLHPSTNNVVTVNSVTVDGNVYGAYASGDGDVMLSGNSVTLSGSTVSGNVDGAYASGDGDTTLSNNSVIVNGGTLEDDVVGAEARNDGDVTATGNSVTVNSGTVEGGVYGTQAYNDGNATVSGNSVTVNSGTVEGDVYGVEAYSSSGGDITASDNSVTVTDGMVEGFLFGASVQNDGGNATASGNSVTIDGGTVDLVWGASASGEASATASGNSVTISGGTVSDVSVAEAYSDGDATASGNSLTISGGTVNGGVYVGYASSTGGNAAASNNNVSISDSTVDGDVYGGYAESGGNATVSGNSTAVNSGGVVEGGVYGGYAESESDVTASGNSVTVNGGTVVDSMAANGNVKGAYVSSESGNVTVVNNSVTINNGMVDFMVTGGEAESGEGAAAASGNSVTVNSGTMVFVNGGVAYSDDGTVTASGNSVTINGGTVGNSVTGGDVNSETGDATASGNSVIMSGGTVGGIDGGYAYSYEGNATASGNSVSISGGTVDGYVDGGSADSDGDGKHGEASYNSVSISGPAQVNGDVYGGISTVDGYGETGSATHNTVTLSGAASFGGDSKIFGGYIDGGTGDAFTGNTLNVHSAGLTIAGLYNFQNLNFYLPTTLAAGGAVLTVTGEADITNSMVNVGIDGARSPLAEGDQVTLIDASQGDLVGAPVNTTANGQGMQGATLQYEFDILTEGDKLLAAVTKAEVAEQAKTLSEASISGLALLTQGADLAADMGFHLARGAASNGRGFSAFAAASGGKSRYNTGSHTDLSGFSLMTGLSKGQGFAGTLSHAVVGAFFEYGNGSYDTYNSFNGIDVNGDGDADYLGGGLLARLDFAKTGSGHVYAEGSFRAGRIDNEYRGGGLFDMLGREVGSFDSSSSYYGLHLGAGYLFDINEKIGLDLYTKYLWTRQGGDSVTLASGDPVEFDDADSHRVRAGARVNYKVQEHITPYVGLAWGHEFAGEANATTYGMKITAPELSGSTGIAEVGLKVKPAPESPLSFDLGVQGYTGQREGVTGNLTLNFEF
jgi:hypothetical protein